MNWKDLRRMVENRHFVNAIYNYCDRWCERCSFTSKCLLHAQDRGEADEELDPENELFWKKLESRLRDTREIIMESARENGIDREALVQAAALAPERLRLNPGDHPLSKKALDYAAKVTAWFDTELGPTIPGLVRHGHDDDVEDAMEVIRWFQFQIGVKLTSALNSRLAEEEEEEELPGGQPHSDGCAKVALIGIERSIAAWGVLLNHFSAHSEIIRSILLQLENLCCEIEQAFPGARSFLRPGFDFMATIQ